MDAPVKNRPRLQYQQPSKKRENARPAFEKPLGKRKMIESGKSVRFTNGEMTIPVLDRLATVGLPKPTNQ
jgi:hypothetical protein